jgi:hypothetical protein
MGAGNGMWTGGVGGFQPLRARMPEMAEKMEATMQ